MVGADHGDVCAAAPHPRVDSHSFWRREVRRRIGRRCELVGFAVFEALERGRSPVLRTRQAPGSLEVVVPDGGLEGRVSLESLPLGPLPRRENLDCQEVAERHEDRSRDDRERAADLDDLVVVPECPEGHEYADEGDGRRENQRQRTSHA